jgi:putative membrane protein
MRQFSVYLAVAIMGLGVNTSARAEDAALPLDDNFLIKAGSCDNAEIQLSKLADKRAGSADVKQFAAQLIRDHEKNYDKLAEVIKNRKVAIVSGFEKSTKDDISRLEKLNGAAFDREFLNQMIAAHTKAIGIFENQVKNGQVADIKAYASETLPKLRDHLKRAEELAKQEQSR